MHRPLMTFAVSDTGEHVTLTSICGCGREAITIPTEHLQSLAHGFLALCGVLGIDVSLSAASVLPFGTPEERRTAETRYAEYVRNAHLKAEAADK